MRIDPQRTGRSGQGDASTTSTIDAVHRFRPVLRGNGTDASFENLLRRRRGVKDRSPLSALEQATLPLVNDPTLLGETRSLEILHHLLARVLPTLDGDAEMLETLERMLLEECDQQRALAEWLAMDPLP